MSRYITYYLNDKQIIVQESSFIRQLHESARDLFREKVFLDLHTCLPDILRTALVTFSQMNFIRLDTSVDPEENQIQSVEVVKLEAPRVDQSIAFLVAVS